MRDVFSVAEIWQENDRTLGVQWTDNTESSLDVVRLRRRCPCAHCVDENTGKRTLVDTQVQETVRPKKIQSVGRYAMSVEFSDGHKTGIYTFRYLRSLAEIPVT